MKLIPILYSTEMVRAKQAGRKSMTRRMRGLDVVNKNPGEWLFVGMKDYSRQNFFCAQFKNENKTVTIKSPYGQPGDILWTRETWFKSLNMGFVYKADGYNSPGTTGTHLQYSPEFVKWKPSIHMPYAACRSWDKLLEVRCERLKNISEADAIAEGIEPEADGGYKSYQIIHSGKHKGTSHPHSILANKFARISYMELWEALNGADSWDENPWVWVLTFQPTEKPNL